MAVEMFAQLPEDLQDALATKAGVVLTDFNPTSPGEATAIQKAILFATSGGVKTACMFTFKDNGADIDNCPKDTMELLEVEKTECTMSGTAVTVSGASAVSMIGLADKSGSEVEEVTPRIAIKPEDFKSLWYVCPYGKKGGFVAVELKNAMSTGGFSMQSEDKGKGKFAFTFKGYSSLKAPEEVPFKFFLKKSGSLPASVVKAEAPIPKGGK